MGKDEGYGSFEEGVSPRDGAAEESDSSGYSEIEAEIFEKLNLSKNKIASFLPQTSSFAYADEKKPNEEKKKEDSPTKTFVSKKSSTMETGGRSPVKKNPSLPTKPTTVGSTK